MKKINSFFLMLFLFSQLSAQNNFKIVIELEGDKSKDKPTNFHVGIELEGDKKIDEPNNFHVGTGLDYDINSPSNQSSQSNKSVETSEQEIQQLIIALRKKTTEFINENKKLAKELINREIVKKIKLELGKRTVKFSDLAKILTNNSKTLIRKTGGMYTNMMELKTSHSQDREEYQKLYNEKLYNERREEVEAVIRRFYREELMTFENQVNEDKLRIIEPFLSSQDKYELEDFLLKRNYDLFAQKVDYIYDQLTKGLKNKSKSEGLIYKGTPPPKDKMPPGTYIDN